MSKDVDVRSGVIARHRAKWLAGLVVLVAVAVAVGLRLIGGSTSEPVEAAEERTLAEQLADRVVTTLEQSSATEHADHGHHFDEAAQGVVCAAETLGYEPAQAAELVEVAVVYVQHMCAEYGPGLVWPGAIRASGPLVAEFDTEPVTILLPEQALPGVEGVVHADRVRAILPEQYHEQVLESDGFDPEVAEGLRARFEAING